VESSVAGDEAGRVAAGFELTGSPGFRGQQVAIFFGDDVGFGCELLAVARGDRDRASLVEVAFELVEALQGVGVEVEVEEAGDGGGLRV